MTQVEFLSIEINTPLPAPVQCFAGQIQLQKSTLVVATYQTPNHTEQSSIISIDNNTTCSIIMKVI